MDNNKFNSIFAESDCITNQMMTDYLEGRLSGITKHLIELHIESCELCKDELEGLSAMKDKNRLSDIIFKLNNEITKRIHGRKKIALFPQVSAMAAIILLLVGFTWFFFYIIHLRPDSLRQAEIAQALDKEKMDELQEYDEVSQKELEKSARIKDTLAIVNPGRIEKSNDEKFAYNQVEEINEMPSINEELALDKKVAIKTDIVKIESSDDKEVIEDEKVVNGEGKKEYAGNVVSGNADVKNIASADSEISDKNEKMISRSKSKKFEDKDSKSLYEQGIEAYSKKEYKKALDLFLKNNENKNVLPEQDYYIAQCYQNLGNNKKAISYYDKVIISQEKKLLEPSLWNKSQAQLKMGQKKEAIESLNQTRELNGAYAIPAQTQIDSLEKK